MLPEEPAKRSALKPILITMVCSFVLAGGSCFAASRTNDLGWLGFFLGVFLLAALSFVITCLWLIVRGDPF
jgi:hypothetical protein